MSAVQDFPFPGVPNTRDDGETVVYVETYTTQGAWHTRSHLLRRWGKDTLS